MPKQKVGPSKRVIHLSKGDQSRLRGEPTPIMMQKMETLSGPHSGGGHFTYEVTGRVADPSWDPD